MSNLKTSVNYSELSKQKLKLQLFITGATPNSTRAVANIKAICELHLKGKYELEIVDVYRHKELAIQNQVIAVPMLIRRYPLPERKLIGDLSKTAKVLEALGIKMSE